MTYNVNDLPIVIFNGIEELSQLALAANLDKLQQQILSSGIEILKSTGEFDSCLTICFNQPPTDMIWATFTKHFTQVHTKKLEESL